MNAKIAVIDLPPICSPGGQGVPDYETTGTLTITDLGAFTNFASYLLNNPSFTWVITTNTLRVRRLSSLAFFSSAPRPHRDDPVADVSRLLPAGLGATGAPPPRSTRPTCREVLTDSSSFCRRSSRT